MSYRGFPLRGHGDRAIYTFCRTVAVFIFATLFRCRCRGAEHLPRDGAAIIVVNHKSDADPIFVGMSFDRPLRYMAKKELFAVPGLRRLVTMLGAFPVDRGAGDRAALERSLAVLAESEVLVMFPEGTRHKDERLHPFLAGVGMIAVRSGAPIVPMAVKGTTRLWRRGPSRVRMLVGETVDLDGLDGRRSEVYAAAAERMRAAVERLYERLD
jgi:1-acyl-sn-glycerol-3-phosphate acyltransferase